MSQPPILETMICAVEPLHLSLVFFFFVQKQQYSGSDLFFFSTQETSGSTRTVLLVNLLPAGFHGDGHAHPTPARGHSGHLAPGVRVWVIALHAVQKCVTVVAPKNVYPCRCTVMPRALRRCFMGATNVHVSVSTS